MLFLIIVLPMPFLYRVALPFQHYLVLLVIFLLFSCRKYLQSECATPLPTKRQVAPTQKIDSNEKKIELKEEKKTDLS
jgi:hypothetical protein